MSKHKHSLSLKNALGEPTDNAAVLALLKKHPNAWALYNQFAPENQAEFLHFMTGKSGINVLYNVFFLNIFNPQTNTARLERMLSALLGKKVKIKGTLPREGIQIIEKGSFVVMDILVELEDGTIFNLEIQKIGYLFPGQRSSCYVSDLIMRQYNRLRGASDKEHPFDYRNMKPVHLLVLMQDSPTEFKEVAPQYMHKRQTSYSSGAKVTELENITYISLDTFRSVVQNNIDNDLHAWLNFLCNYEPAAILNLISKYPEFIPIYQEIARFRTNPEEVIYMYSEALLEMDRNTERYMLELTKKEAQEQVDAAMKQLNAVNLELDVANQKLDATNQKLDATNQKLDATNQKLNATQSENARLKALLAEHSIPFDE